MNWTADNIEDQSGKTAIITGANSGLGFESAKQLARRGAEIIMACRSEAKGHEAIDKIRHECSTAKLEFIQLDLSSLQSIKQFTYTFMQKHDRLDILMNNAGLMIPPYGKTIDGFELQMGVNHLGHFALTGLLIQIIKESPCTRIINLSSNAHKIGNIDFSDINWERRKYIAWKAYGDSKIANIYFTIELARRLAIAGQNTIVAAAHPGWTNTNLMQHNSMFEKLAGFLAQDLKMGALPQLFAATADNVRSGDYFGPHGFMEWKGYPHKTSFSKRGANTELAQLLWEVSEQMTGIRFHL